MFQLMCKDEVCAEFELEQHGDYALVRDLNVISTLPFGCFPKTLENWLRKRKAIKHKKDLTRMLEQMGYFGTFGFIKATHCISLNDCNWVREVNENVSWNDISPYRNSFDVIMQAAAFCGPEIHVKPFSTTSPEFTTDGAFRKCWVNEGTDIYLFKRGNDSMFKRGLESYSEVLASAVYEQMKAGIRYELATYRGHVASKCKLFTSEDKSFAQFRYLRNNHTLPYIVKFYDALGSDMFRRILICDAIVLNTDRHTGNHGILYDPVSHKYLSTAPGFDYNLALCPSLTLEEFIQFKDMYAMLSTHHGGDFVYTAHNLLTDAIRKDLLNLRDIVLSFPKYDTCFTQERCDILTKVVNMQIDNILNNTHNMCNFSVSDISDTMRYRLKHAINRAQWMTSEQDRVMKELNVSFIDEIEREIHRLL